MRFRRSLFRYVLSLMLMILFVSIAFAQNNEAARQYELPLKISEFLRSDAAMKKATYKGQQVVLPKDLKEDLEQFYLHKFTILKMSISFDISHRAKELLIVTNAKTGAVESYFWQQDWERMPDSFSKIFMAYPDEKWRVGGYWSEIYTLSQLYALAKVMLYLQRNEKTMHYRGVGPRVGSLQGPLMQDKNVLLSAEIIPEREARYKLVLEMKWVKKSKDAWNDYDEYAFGSLKIIPVKQ